MMVDTITRACRRRAGNFRSAAKKPKLCPVSEPAPQSPRRTLVGPIIPVHDAGLARVRVCLRVGRNGPRNLRAARSSARLSPYMMPVSRACACVSGLVAMVPPIKSQPPAAGRNFPVPLGRASVGCGAELAFKFLENRGAVALAGKVAVETTVEDRLDADRQEDTHHLPLKRAAQRVELNVRPP